MRASLTYSGSSRPARPPALNSAVLKESYQRSLDRFRTSADAAAKYLSHGESPRDATLDAAELAAYTAVASLILNLDEVVTKE